MYVGHEGTKAMIVDIGKTLGDFRMVWDDFTELPDGRVLAEGHVAQATAGGEVAGPHLDVYLTLRDGLVAGLVSAQHGAEP